MATKKAEKSHREKKNGTSRDQWEKRKAQFNAARSKQVFVVDRYKQNLEDGAADVEVGHYERVPA